MDSCTVERIGMLKRRLRLRCYNNQVSMRQSMRYPLFEGVWERKEHLRSLLLSFCMDLVFYEKLPSPLFECSGMSTIGRICTGLLGRADFHEQCSEAVKLRSKNGMLWSATKIPYSV